MRQQSESTPRAKNPALLAARVSRSDVRHQIFIDRDVCPLKGETPRELAGNTAHNPRSSLPAPLATAVNCAMAESTGTDASSLCWNLMRYLVLF
ncbi:hypothetical protein ElyMa_003355700 [Elysia marginata]|uniref:Uncharacterized protein n=1 Tax=Elysia marginata TaxID=1093978 RepID=A0AAV4JK69_9GAST|nr:hypothetical protein ElyMa_003355700 [Elysia marginata]